MSDSLLPFDQEDEIWAHFLSNPEPEPNPFFDLPVLLSPNRVLRKKPMRTSEINMYLKPRIQSCFKSLNFRERCRLIKKLYDVLCVLELNLEDFYEVFEDFYYEMEKEDFEPLMATIYDEIENQEVCFLEEYEREQKELLLICDMERDFWETQDENPEKKKKKPKKRKKTDKNDKIARINQQIQKLFQEREEFFNSEGHFFIEKKDLVFESDYKSKTPIENCGSSNTLYKLRDRSQKNTYKPLEQALDKEEAQIYNRKFRMKYSELLKQKRNDQEMPKKTISPAKTVVLTEEAIKEKVERNLALQWIRKKSNYPSCFIEEKPNLEEENEKEVNSKSETVRLMDLGQKNKGYQKKNKGYQKKIKSYEKKKKDGVDEKTKNIKKETRGRKKKINAENSQEKNEKKEKEKVEKMEKKAKKQQEKILKMQKNEKFQKNEKIQKKQTKSKKAKNSKKNAKETMASRKMRKKEELDVWDENLCEEFRPETRKKVKKTTEKKDKITRSMKEKEQKPLIREVIHLENEEKQEKEFQSSNIIWNFDEFNLNTSSY